MEIHGCKGMEEVVYVGSLHKDLRKRIGTAISHSGFPATDL